MNDEPPKQDPQDKAFGAAASRDQEVVDALEEQGVTEDELPDEPARHPRSAGKAEPVKESGKRDTGEARAKGNQEEDPPA
jgi:hypothetical protein